MSDLASATSACRDPCVVGVPGSSRVTYDVDTAEFLVDGVHAEYQGSVDNLKAELEG